MVGNTIKEVVCSLGKTLWNRYRQCPFHQQDSRDGDYTANISDLLAAMTSVSPGTNSQKAITPELLRCIASSTSSELRNNADDHTADLIIGAFFFAMRSCEFSKTSIPGKTIMIHLGGVKFFAEDRSPIHQDNPRLLELAVYVWILFED